ncbi:folate-binding protein YgfZ [Opitutus terrae PB90-1]|uniref:Folate-binding protein YgfZ n=1 Tax=Opitutus terrae (strain DSM 11246 / JCM 15787 / PB90-1) TaxID=452637 RepID=B1ZRV2_OPITP|nr:folate-binding protein YgfZ [Opitutus terrae PB90-1]
MSGPDAFTFLQGQFTNDLRAIAAGPVYGLWLNQKARVLADSFVFRTAEDEFWVGSYFAAARTISERLEAYIIADDVTVEDRTASWVGLTVSGSEVGENVSRTLRERRFEFAGRRGIDQAREWFLPIEEAERVNERLGGAVELNAAEMERRRVGARIPAVPTDIGPGELPNEGGLEAVAISYTKGCYLGQEVIARLRSMGQVRRRLFLVRGTDAMPARPAPLFQGERQLGELRSAIANENGEGFRGLALLTLLNLQPEVPLVFAPGAAAENGCVIDPT